jgi:hypothetical protein
MRITVVIEMHSSYKEWDVSTESDDNSGSLWTCLASIQKVLCVLIAGFNSGAVYVVRVRQVTEFGHTERDKDTSTFMTE